MMLEEGHSNNDPIVTIQPKAYLQTVYNDIYTSWWYFKGPLSEWIVVCEVYSLLLSFVNLMWITATKGHRKYFRLQSKNLYTQGPPMSPIHSHSKRSTDTSICFDDVSWCLFLGQVRNITDPNIQNLRSNQSV